MVALHWYGHDFFYFIILIVGETRAATCVTGEVYALRTESILFVMAYFVRRNFNHCQGKWYRKHFAEIYSLGWKHLCVGGGCRAN